MLLLYILWYYELLVLFSITVQGAPQESLTSSEFERFLAERAAAAENIPSGSSSTTTSSPRHRKPHKEKEEPSLFAM